MTDAISSRRSVQPQQKEIDLSAIGPNTPLRLSVAARLAYPDGSMTVSGLRVMIARGLLESELTANKVYVTLGDIEQMRAQCRENRKGRVSTSGNAEGEDRSGSSSTDQSKSALAAAQAIGAELRKPSPPTSAKSTSPTGETVIQLR
jgi:hypothetical protein